MDSPFFNDLVERLRRVRLDALPGIVAALDAAAAGKPVKPSAMHAGAGGDVDRLAGVVVKSAMPGSKLDAVERAVVLHAVETCNGNISAAARLLGVDRKALERRYRHYRKDR